MAKYSTYVGIVFFVILTNSSLMDLPYNCSYYYIFIIHERLKADIVSTVLIRFCCFSTTIRCIVIDYLMLIYPSTGSLLKHMYNQCTLVPVPSLG